MLFADSALVSRIEGIECRLLSDSAASMARRRPEEDGLIVPISGGVATYSGATSPLNKVAGLGFHGPIQEDVLERIEQEFARRRAMLSIELATLAPPSFARFLTRRGYVLHGFENVLGRQLPVGMDRPCAEGIEIALCSDSELQAWLDVVVTAFANPDTQGLPSHESAPSRDVLERVISDMIDVPGFQLYLARRHGEPAGGAGLRICDGIAQLCGAATLPRHRRHGVQSALLAARLQDAGEAGCDVAVVTTQPGSKSQENVQAQEFQLLYSRAILIRDFSATGEE